MTVGVAIAEAAARLAGAGVTTPRIDAELVARHVLGWSPVQLVLRSAEPLAQPAAARLGALVERRAAREPLQLILGSVGFRYLDVKVAPGVFIPRPETELLAGEAVAATPVGGVVIEPCTGTGAVACAVAAESRAATVVATDTDARAVALARSNARAAGASVLVAQGDLLAPVGAELRGAVDVLVSNPPYLAAAETAGLEPEVARWDPPAALVAGVTGHEVSDRLITEAGQWLAPGGVLLLEVSELRAEEAARRCRAAGLVEEAVLPDLTGRPRIVRARRRPG